MITVPHPWIDVFIFTMYARLIANITTLVLSMVAVYYINQVRNRNTAVLFVDYNLRGAAVFFTFFSIATIIGLYSGAYAEYDWVNVVIAFTITIGAIIFAFTKIKFVLWLLCLDAKTE